MAGHYPDASQLTYEASALMQPAIDRALADMATELYAGEWRDERNLSARVVVIDKGTLYDDGYALEGVDALQEFGAEGRLALRQCHKFTLWPIGARLTDRSLVRSGKG